MIGTRGRIRAWIIAASLVTGSSAALACGYEDPKSAESARGALNWAFPNALHVVSAVWKAQLESVIARDEVPPSVKALLGYHKAAERLGAFRDRLASTLEANAAPAFSMVLIGPVLWTRFEPRAESMLMTAHVEGPASGDAVIVTDGPVIEALIDGRLAPQVARETGLMRLYGTPHAVKQLTSWLDRRLPRNGNDATRVGH